MPFLKTKSYYIPVKGNIDPIKIMDQVGVGLCPRLVFINQDANSKENYLNDYVKETCGLLLDINEI